MSDSLLRRCSPENAVSPRQHLLVLPWKRDHALHRVGPLAMSLVSAGQVMIHLSNTVGDEPVYIVCHHTKGYRLASRLAVVEGATFTLMILWSNC